MVKDLLGDAEFVTIIEQAQAAVNAVNASSSKWLLRVKTQQRQIYGVTLKLMKLATTRWNSMQMCLASLLRVRKALQLFADLNQDEPDFPKACSHWLRQDWWKTVEAAEFAVRPLSAASFLMQRDGNTLAHVFLMFANLYRHFGMLRPRTEDDPEVAIKNDSLVLQIEKRWHAEEQHIFFLGFCVHPFFRLSAFALLEASYSDHGSKRTGSNPFCLARVLQAAKFYFEKWELYSSTEKMEDEKVQLGNDLMGWLKQEPSMMKDFNPWNEMDARDNPVGFWLVQSQEFPVLSLFASFLLCCPVQSASCERMFKDWQFYHTKTRNQLAGDKILKLMQIKRDMRQQETDRRGVNASRRAGSRRGATQQPNRIISQKERKRVVFTNDDSTGMEQQDGEQEEGVDGDEVLDDEESGPVVITWMEILNRALPNEPESDDGEDEFDHELAATLAGMEDDDEFPPEKRNDNLPPLPTENARRYPQESHHYIRSLNNVRSDKFSLHWMLYNKVEISSMLSVYGDGSGSGPESE